jgi:site-specific recombinase XerD
MTADLSPVYPASTLAAARQAEQEALTGDDGWAKADTQATVWLRSPRFTEGTREQYGAIYTSWREWCLQTGITPLEAKRSDVLAYALALEKIGNPAARRPRPLAKRSIARHLAGLSSYYTRAVDSEVTDRNPVPMLDRPRVPKTGSQQPHLTREENRALLAAADAAGRRTAALVALLMLACLRISEALTVQIEDLTHQNGDDFVKVRRKGDKTDRVVLAPEAAVRVRAAIGARRSGPILTTSTGRRLDRKAAWDIIRRLGQNAGITVPIGPHTLRHAYITRGIELELAIDGLRKAAGHESVVTTQGYDRSGYDRERHPSFQIARDLAGDEDDAGLPPGVTDERN